MTDRYRNFSELQAHEIKNVDYRIIQRNGKWPVLIMAPHGGRIEPYTSQISDWIAGGDFSLYIFESVKSDYSRELHITSHNFDEPLALEAVGRADLVLTVHGLRNSTDEFIMIGGLDVDLGNDIKKALHKVGFTVEKSEIKYSGQRPDNICNRGRRGKGVQLEITYALRKRIFEDLDYQQRFINAVRSTLFERLEAEM